MSSLLQAFDRQAEWCAAHAPFTARVLQRGRLWLQRDASAHDALAAIASEPLVAAVPLRWLGGLHHLALRGLAPWAPLWLRASGTDAQIDAALRGAWARQRPHMQAALSGPPQTNEVQRSVALLPGLLHVAARTGLPLRLLEIGASAGLNLWCDRYHHDHGRWAWGDAQAPLRLQAEWRGDIPAEAAATLHIAHRAACDAQPVDLSQPDEALRLASFIWPDQAERLARLRAAAVAAGRWMADTGVAVQALPAADFLARELHDPVPGLATVVMHSVVWQYIPPAQQQAAQASIEAAGARASAAHPLAWLRLEPGQDYGIPELRCRLWPGGDDRLLARVHAHGAWVQWLSSPSR